MAYYGSPSPQSTGASGENGSRAMAAKLPSPDGRWSRRTAYAAIDLGTKNCRLLIAKHSDDGFIVVDAFSRIVRLGEGCATTGGLCGAAMDRDVDAPRVGA